MIRTAATYLILAALAYFVGLPILIYALTHLWVLAVLAIYVAYRVGYDAKAEEIKRDREAQEGYDEMMRE